MDPNSVPEGIRPGDIQPLGNYAVQITWEDGFNQVAPFDLLESLERLPKPEGFDPDAPGAADAAQGASEAKQILATATGYQQTPPPADV